VPSVPNPADLVGRVRQDVERNLLRTRNGLKYVAGVDRPQVGLTPKDVVWSRDKAKLHRYRNDDVRFAPPLVIVHSLVSKSYILDLYPGNSFIEQMRDAGLDVFLLDWGTPDEREAENTLETYAEDYIPRALRAACEIAGVEEVNVLGYCFGGVLSLLAAAAGPDLPIRALIAMATPVDFHQMGLFGDMFGDGRLNPEDVIDATGNVPPDVIQQSFRVLKPTAEAATYANLWQNLWNDKHMEGFQAMGQWTRDHIPFPGAAFRQTVEMLMRRNGMVTDSLVMSGRPVHMGDIRYPFLNVMAEKDHIVPGDSARPVTSLVGSKDKEELVLNAGHVGLVAGRQAKNTTIPKIIDWVIANSDAVNDFAVKGA